MKKTLSVDLRERIVAACDAKEGTREEVAKRFKVSVGMVKKQLSQRARTGDLRPRHRFSGRKARLMPDMNALLQGDYGIAPTSWIKSGSSILAAYAISSSVHSSLDEIKDGLLELTRRRE